MLCFIPQHAGARTWTDVKGRTIEAEIVRKDGDVVVVKKGGKEVRLPLKVLSDADKEYVEEWEEENGESEKEEEVKNTGEITLGGQTIEKGGKTNQIVRPYSPETLQDSQGQRQR